MSLTDLLVMKEVISIPDSLIYALIGFIFVFIGIALLIAVVELIGIIIEKTNEKLSLKKKQAEAVITQSNFVSAIEDEIPDEVKAAIVAAIMAYYSAENPKCEFIVKKIKRI